MTAAELDEKREALFDAPCYVIDFLPRQVPAESGERYFPAERYFAEHPRIDALYERFARLILCLCCYYAAAAEQLPDGDWIEDPSPIVLAELIEGCAADGENRYLTVLFPEEDVLFTLDGGDLYMSLYNPSDRFLADVSALAAAEGLFVRKAAG